MSGYLTSGILIAHGFTEHVIYPGECYLAKGMISFECDTHPEDQFDIFPTVLINGQSTSIQINTKEEFDTLISHAFTYLCPVAVANTCSKYVKI